MQQSTGHEQEEALITSLGRVGFLSSIIGAVILTIALLANIGAALLGKPLTGLIATLLQGGVGLSAILGGISTGVTYHTRWRIVRGKERLSVRDEAADQALETPGRLQNLPGALRSQLGCASSLSLIVLFGALALLVTQTAMAAGRPIVVVVKPTPSATTLPTATATSAPTATAIPTKVPPTATPIPPTFTPVPPPIYSVSPTTKTQMCSSTSSLIPMSFSIVATRSPSPVTWTATAVEKLSNGKLWATIAPTSDTVNPGQTESFNVTPASSVCQDIGLASKTFHIKVAVDNGQSTSIAITINPHVIP